MRKSRLLGAVCSCIFGSLSTPSHAALVEHGALTTYDDGSTNIITDTQNNYEWLMFDVLADATYSDTLAVLNTQNGGGWSIAGQSEAILFLDALLSVNGNSCVATDSAFVICGWVSSWSDGSFGNNFDESYDYAWFESDTAGFVGYVRIRNDGEAVYNPLWHDYPESDRYSAVGDIHISPVSWLLYRDATVIPIPPALWLFGSGLLSLIGVARGKKSS